MNSNNSQKYKSKNDKRIVDKNYKTAQEYETKGKYKKAIELYSINITKYNHPLSKVRLAELYLSGKAGKIDNKYARKLLEEAYNQKCIYGRDLLAYTLANGIGGKKDKTRAYSMFLDELNEKNPDPMVYLEIVKLMPKSKKNKNIVKSLNKCVTYSERVKYNRKVSIDKFNNSKLGQIVNRLPNYISTKLEILKEAYDEKKSSYNLEELYNRAEKMYSNGDFETARRIFKRLSLYGDNDSKIKYAKMCYKGIGGKKDLETAREIFVELIDKRNRKLERIDKEIYELETLIEDISKEKNSLRNSKIKKEAKEDIKYLKTRKSNIYKNANYDEACLYYGLVLVDSYQNSEELKEGIEVLKSFAKHGEHILGENEKLTKYGKQYNRRARIAIKKLGNLYEQGKWKPQNIEKARDMFNKFSVGKISKYTSYISDKMAGKVTYTRKKTESKIYKKPKKYKITYSIAALCELLSINSVARKLYTKMCEGGNYKGAYSLATLEHDGKGGKVDLESAKKHYRDYIRSTVDCEEKDERILRFSAVNDLATLYMEENDISRAVQLYKIAVMNGNHRSKKNLKILYKEGKWSPKNKKEYEWVKPRGIEKILRKPKVKTAEKIKRKITMPNINIKKPVAAAIAAATTISAFTYNSTNLNGSSQETSNEIHTIDENKSYNYVIGDEVGIFKNNNLVNSVIVGIVAYNAEKQTRIDLDNQEFNYENFGLSSEEYIEKISKEKKLDKNSIRLLYCLKNKNSTKWVDPIEDEIIVLKRFNNIKKEEVGEYLV